MTVIAWDGRFLAADRRSTQSGLIRTTSKIRQTPNGDIIAFNGALENGHALLGWYENGADLDKWPACQTRDQWAELIVVNRTGLVSYEAYPVPMRTFDSFGAFGAGAEVALGAMAMGATAIKAVEIACQFHNGCGNGCEWFEFRPQVGNDLS